MKNVFDGDLRGLDVRVVGKYLGILIMNFVFSKERRKYYVN